MKLKYASKSYPSNYISKMGCSNVWRRILKGKELAGDNIRWTVVVGSMNFWYDKWWFSHMIGDNMHVLSDLQKLTIKEALTHSDK